MFIVFDLDGTLACCEHRLHHIREFDLDCGEPGKVDWDAFYLACVDDKPLKATIATMTAFRAAGARVEIWTGRSDLVRRETERWLIKHGIAPTFTLMRSHGDHQPDVELKRAWLHDLPVGKRPTLVFEDRTRVVKMFRDEGIPCFQVAEGAF